MRRLLRLAAGAAAMALGSAVLLGVLWAPPIGADYTLTPDILQRRSWNFTVPQFFSQINVAGDGGGAAGFIQLEEASPGTDVAIITPGTLTGTRTLTIPDGSGTIPLPSLAQTWGPIQTFTTGVATPLINDDGAAGPELRISGASSLAQNGSSGFAQLTTSANWAIADTGTAPTQSGEQTLGSCSASNGAHTFYIEWLTPTGHSALTPPLTYTPSAASRKVLIVRPSDFPTGTTAYNVYWSRSGQPIRNCASGSSTTAIGTTPFSCACQAGATAANTNTTAAASTSTWADGYLGFPQYGTAAPFTITPNATRIYPSPFALGIAPQSTGPQPQYSTNSGTTKGWFAMLSPTTREFCQHGCVATDRPDFTLEGSSSPAYIDGATTSTSNRFNVHFAAGTYESTSHHLRPWTSYFGDGGTASRFTSTGTEPSDSGVAGCFDLNAATNNCPPGNCSTVSFSGIAIECPFVIDTPVSGLIFERNTVGTPGGAYHTGIRTYQDRTGTSTAILRNNTVRALSRALRMTSRTGTQAMSIIAVGNVYEVNKSGNSNGTYNYARGIDAAGNCENYYSVGETFSVVQDQAGQEAVGIKLDLSDATVYCTRMTFISPRIIVSNTNGSATADVYGVWVTGNNASTSGTRVLIQDPVIEVSSAGASGTVYGIRVDNADTDLTVQVHGGKIATSGGATRVDLSANARTFTDGVTLTSNAQRQTGLASKPATCTVGDTYIDNTAGQVAWCLCTATDTWTAVGGTGTCN